MIKQNPSVPQRNFSSDHRKINAILFICLPNIDASLSVDISNRGHFVLRRGTLRYSDIPIFRYSDGGLAAAHAGNLFIWELQKRPKCPKIGFFRFFCMLGKIKVVRSVGSNLIWTLKLFLGVNKLVFYFS